MTSAGNSINKIYSITFDSKGNYVFSKDVKELKEIIVTKDDWEYESSTGVWTKLNK